MAKTDAAQIAVCDSGPVIHLSELNHLDVIADFRAWLAEPVWLEVEKHRSAALQSSAWTCERRVVSAQASPSLLALSRAIALDAGELGALTLMAGVPDALFLTDDAAARLVAIELGYRVHGTVGMIVRAIRRRQLPARDAIACLRSIPTRSTLYIRPALLAQIIEQVHLEYPDSR